MAEAFLGVRVTVSWGWVAGLEEGEELGFQVL